MVLVVAVFAADLVGGVLPPGASSFFQKFASCVIFFAAGALCIARARVAGAERRAWRLFAVATTLWGAGALYYAVALWDRSVVPYPSVADAFWLAFYIPAFGALGSLLRSRAVANRGGIWLDGLVAGLGVGGTAAAIAFQEVLESSGGSPVATLTNLAYPVGDLGLLALVFAAIAVTGWRHCGVWRWIAAAFAVFAVCDSVYLIQVADGNYATGHVVDLGWPFAALVLGIAAWRPEQRTQVAPRDRASIAVPAASGLAALALLVVDHFTRTNLLALALSTASIFAILTRLYLTVKDNERMLAASRREALTDALTGLGNRRQLAADIAARLDYLDPEHPVMLTLFDLDGFKQYNDTFGHPAGDQLLERLGARLFTVLEDHGTAYRMGGDEFCALWHLSDAGEASVAVTDSVAALSDRGEGFEIGCSYGSVLLPNETTDPTDALRLADRRMYVRKRGGRASAGRQSSDVLLRALAERDADLSVHIGGVAELACAAGRHLALGQEELEALRLAALLHDVGKVAIPDAILHKPGPLDEHEWDYIKRHTIIGERIVCAAPALAPVARYVRSSHERYDGTGYPDGLAGEEIPLASRIVAVSDAYDAMVADRPYRDRWTSQQSLVELQRCSGTQFDPRVVEAFVAAVRDSHGSPVER
jgi:diguanylate cyclase (GGDEF)-like protein